MCFTTRGPWDVITTSDCECVCKCTRYIKNQKGAANTHFTLRVLRDKR